MRSDPKTSLEDISRISVFDTNAYRNLTFGLSVEDSKQAAQRLVGYETAAKTKALANPFVIWELIAHLDDTNDPAYTHCRNAIVALVEHTRRQSDEDGGICRVADGETELCRQLFHKLPPRAEENAGNLCKLASHVWKNAPLLNNPAAETNFQAFRSALDERESVWLDRMENFLQALRSAEGGVVRKFLNSPDFVQFCAAGRVASIASLLELHLSPSDVKEAVSRLTRIFPTALRLMQASILKWFNAPDMNLRNPKRRRANFIWDTALCFGIGEHLAIGDAAIQFVTDDGEIHSAAHDAGCEDRVVTLADYEKNLNSSK